MASPGTVEMASPGVESYDGVSRTESSLVGGTAGHDRLDADGILSAQHESETPVVAS